MLYIVMLCHKKHALLYTYIMLCHMTTAMLTLIDRDCSLDALPAVPSSGGGGDIRAGGGQTSVQG
jgi:hypothetical protein